MLLPSFFSLSISQEFVVAGNYVSSVLMLTGNGYIGVEATPASQLYIKSGRTLSFPVRFYPIVEISLEGYRMAGIGIVEYCCYYYERCYLQYY